MPSLSATWMAFVLTLGARGGEACSEQRPLARGDARTRDRSAARVHHRADQSAFAGAEPEHDAQLIAGAQVDVRAAARVLGRPETRSFSAGRSRSSNLPSAADVVLASQRWSRAIHTVAATGWSPAITRPRMRRAPRLRSIAARSGPDPGRWSPARARVVAGASPASPSSSRRLHHATRSAITATTTATASPRFTHRTYRPSPRVR